MNKLNDGAWTLYKSQDSTVLFDLERIKDWKNIFAGTVGLQLYAEHEGHDCIVLRWGDARFKKLSEGFEADDLDEEPGIDTWLYETDPEDEDFKIWSVNSNKIEG